jgi:DNA-binding MarR family transcriptional regulator
MDELAHCLENLENDYRRLDRLYNDFAKLHGETYLSLATLEVLDACPEGVSQKQIGQEVFASKQTVNSLMRSFEKRGLVEQRASETDGRSRIHVLTEQGRLHAAHTVGALRAIDRKIAEQIGAEDLRRMHELDVQYASEFERTIHESRMEQHG